MVFWRATYFRAKHSLQNKAIMRRSPGRPLYQTAALFYLQQDTTWYLQYITFLNKSEQNLL
jgi:hypothetical protein